MRQLGFGYGPVGGSLSEILDCFAANCDPSSESATKLSQGWVEKGSTIYAASIDLRRTLGSWLSGQEYSLQLIGKALNHSSFSTTQIYARLDINTLREALEQNARLMFGKDAQSGKSPS